VKEPVELQSLPSGTRRGVCRVYEPELMTVTPNCSPSFWIDPTPSIWLLLALYSVIIMLCMLYASSCLWPQLRSVVKCVAASNISEQLEKAGTYVDIAFLCQVLLEHT
jgi:hypothetical protein